ncbi:MAG: cytochrome c biogenesis protein ResB [Nitrospirae bacterium]|uniref:cytochrome c biogenesis protein ResB n=1 Tax=Candidatus Magnetobacterium casense TaxID=1455061 RepID=UPI00058DEE4F|nr:cytochrome c biogenesis protein ResB [Candidatus Magnetobacterium casensis]MBF0337930.1 cytochrome c biogenesis protein ResB [Nitrospirota bacterium]
MTDRAKDKTSVVNAIWRFFSSVRLAVALIALIGLLSILGTVIEQNAEPEKNVRLFKKLLGDALAPTAYRISESLGFMDMYSSWWFSLLLALLAVNLVVCSFDRLPGIRRMVSKPIEPLKEDGFGHHGINKDFTAKGTLTDVSVKVQAALKQLGFNPTEVTSDRGIQYYAQKWQHARYAVYVIHLSIIVILAGAVIGIQFGFHGFMKIDEGQTTDETISRKGEKHHLGFSIRCDDFSLQFYGDTDTPKTYLSWLTVMESGKEVLKTSIEVNRPLSYKGYTFYQASYGALGEENGVLIFRMTSKNGKSEVISKYVGDSFKLPESDLEARIMAFSPALGFNKDEKPYTYTEMLNNPAVYVLFREKGNDKYGGWIFKRYPKSWDIPDGSKLELIDNWGYQYTGIQVRKDPGVWIVYLGCICMTLGLYFAFFLSHKRIWVLLLNNKGNVEIKIAASAHKNKGAFDTNIDKAFGTLRDQVTADKKGG